MDNFDQRTFDNGALKYVPHGFLGASGANENRLVIVECVGIHDVKGLLKVIPCQEYVLHRLQVCGQFYVSTNGFNFNTADLGTRSHGHE
jgi:hypothetical protein